MSRIRMHVFISNESDATLILTRSEIAHGSFTASWSPPATINPGRRVGFQGEGDFTLTATTGTEGRVYYNIVAPDGSGGELYIHWDSPLIESQYGNTFHVWAPANWEVTHTGGQGHDAELDIRLRRSVRRNVPNFYAEGRGFAFTNHWDPALPVVTLGLLWNKLFDSLPGPLGSLGVGRLMDESWAPITHADMGMCGGMVYALMDYHAAHLLPPDGEKPPDSPNVTLFEFIRDRLWDSFDVGGEGHRFLGYSSPHYPNGDEGVVQAVGLTRGRAWITYRDAWQQIQQDIDSGSLSPLGLVHTDNLDIGANHQVLAYGYKKSGQDVELYIYDPNEGQREVTLRFNITATDGEVNVKRLVGGKEQNPHHIYCIFRLNGYVPKTPPGGQTFQNVRKALRATTLPPYTVRSSVATSPVAKSVTGWLRSL